MPPFYVPFPTSRKYHAFSITPRKYRVFPLLIFNFQNTSMDTKTRVLCRLFFGVYINTTQTLPSQIHLWLQKTRVLCHLFSEVHITTTQIPFSPITHKILSIYLHTSILHSFKTQHLPQFTSFFKLTHIYRTMWVNL